MARFRRSGVNWEGRAWETSPALNSLMDEIETAFPLPGPGDGTVASKEHDRVSPTSDHRPYPYTGPGVVNAVDAGEYVEDQGEAIFMALWRSQDSRLRYAIHEGKVFYTYARNDGFQPWDIRPYKGLSPHGDHTHTSIDRAHQNDASPWDLGLGNQPPQGGNMSQYGPENWDSADWVAFNTKAGWKRPLSDMGTDHGPGQTPSGTHLLTAQGQAKQANVKATAILKAINSLEEIDSEALAADIATQLGELSSEEIAQATIDALVAELTD